MAYHRVVLHSDLNAFYASVEIMLNPSLRGKAVAVCGRTEDRHGIVLAKSEKAKKTGIKTGMANWEAQKLCPGLIIVPPQYRQYLKYSQLAREIYRRFTDQVEPFGMDECWLDVTGSQQLWGSGPEIASHISRTIQKELGLTVSIGVSFNKVFAKLGSDMRKPNAITVISPHQFQEIVWPLPADKLIYVGRSTKKKLAIYGINTIGGIAAAGPAFMQRRLGKNGVKLWLFACGLDQSRVVSEDYQFPIKSVGRGITCREDLLTPREVWRVMLELCQEVGHRLRDYQKQALGVQITVKNNQLYWRQYQTQLTFPTQSPMVIARRAHGLFTQNYFWQNPVRAVTVRAIKLVPADRPRQIRLFEEPARQERQDRLEKTIENLRDRFGKNAVINAVLLGDLKIGSREVHEVILPGIMDH